MDDNRLKLPIGIENFDELRRYGFYYVDKTDMLRDLLMNWGKVNLFTRPRRFGKSLNMSMLKVFFEYGCDAALFDGLAISGEKELCEEYMGKFPVVSVSLKDVCGDSFESARNMLRTVIENEAMRFPFLADSDRLSEREKEDYLKLTGEMEAEKGDALQSGGETAAGKDRMPDTDDFLMSSLYRLTSLLRRHYGQDVILLIDEYDVPLDKAFHSGYYNRMILLIRGMFSMVLKGNDNLRFAVMTGCLKISKESIFTGLNNLQVFSITNVRFNEYFGFTDDEVRQMLAYYGLSKHYAKVKEWYDGYHFGGEEIYCPWDVINFVNLLRSEPDTFPRSFWINSSSNEIVRRLIRMAGRADRRDLEQLVDGGSVVKKINQELTYQELYDSAENVWSVLFMTGYLTQLREVEKNEFELVIPNREIREIFVEQILKWFQEEARKDVPKLNRFCDAFLRGDAQTAEEIFSDYLNRTISIRDTAARAGQKENFYHGVLLGLLSYRGDWDVYSNRESGDGFSDIQVESDSLAGIVIEVKYPDEGDLEKGCREALAQIEEKRYADRLIQNGMRKIFKYGVACRKKSCRIMGGAEITESAV